MVSRSTNLLEAGSHLELVLGPGSRGIKQLSRLSYLMNEGEAGNRLPERVILSASETGYILCEG